MRLRQTKNQISGLLPLRKRENREDFGVLKADFYPEAYKAIREGHIRTLGDLNEALWAWLERIYHERVHSETGRTPLEVFRDGLNHVRPADPVKASRAFLWRYQRLVSKNGFISLLGNTYSLDPAWACQKIELRLDPHDLSRVEVYRDRRPVARAQVRELKKVEEGALVDSGGAAATTTRFPSTVSTRT